MDQRVPGYARNANFGVVLENWNVLIRLQFCIVSHDARFNHAIGTAFMSALPVPYMDSSTAEMSLETAKGL